MRLWHAGLALGLVIALGLILWVLKPQPYVAMAPAGAAVTVAMDVPAAEALPAQASMASMGDLPASTTTDSGLAGRQTAGGSFREEASTHLAAPEPPAVTISQDVPTANVPVPDAAARPQDDPGPPPGMDPGNGPPPGPPPDDDMGPPPGGGPPAGMRPPN
jgi:hypothetical protein